MADTLTKRERSLRMARVRARGNASTEAKVESVLTLAGISGWVKHPDGVVGKPDFYFPEIRVALFVDGCFWHACPKCGRIPKSRVAFWRAKIERNRRRDETVRRRLRANGFHVFRIWEHEVKDGRRWLRRLRMRLEQSRFPWSQENPVGRVEGATEMFDVKDDWRMVARRIYMDTNTSHRCRTRS